jgi:hypothetical protein
MNMSDPWLLRGAVVALLLVHRFVLANRSQVWLAAIVPTLWAVTIVVLGVRGMIDDLRGWLAVLTGLLALVVLADNGQAARRKRLQREDERIDAINAQGASGRRGTPPA